MQHRERVAARPHELVNRLRRFGSYDVKRTASVLEYFPAEAFLMDVAAQRSSQFGNLLRFKRDRTLREPANALAI